MSKLFSIRAQILVFWKNTIIIAHAVVPDGTRRGKKAKEV
jgi:hypothetical protein